MDSNDGMTGALLFTSVATEDTCIFTLGGDVVLDCISCLQHGVCGGGDDVGDGVSVVLAVSDVSIPAR